MADIGADHGALSCALVAGGRVPRAIAVDVAMAPAARARAAVALGGLSGQVEVRHGDGLGPLDEGEVGTIVICGMGGETMRRILELGRSKLIGVQRLVLSPHTAAAELRRYLVASGWRDEEGCWVHDRGHSYPVAAWERGDATWTDVDYRWGRSARAQLCLGLAAHLQAERERLSIAHASALAGRKAADPQVQGLQQSLRELDGELARLV